MGLFSGVTCAVAAVPGAPGAGIRFRKPDPAAAVLEARVDHWIAAPRRTALSGGAWRVDTVEHLLAAVTALELDDLDLVVDGPEIPIVDGSFQPFLDLLNRAGVVETEGDIDRWGVTTPIEVRCGDAHYVVSPAPVLTVDVTLVYSQPVIGTQRVVVTLEGDAFERELAAARTFGFRADIERAQGAGTLRGATEDAGIALEAHRVVNTTLRWPDEFVRHKAGDLIGDLALLGARLEATVQATRPSHEGNIACVRAIRAAALTGEG